MSRRLPIVSDVAARPIGLGQELLLIGSGGACGALARASASGLLAGGAGAALAATQVVNLAGAFALGLLLARLETTGPRPRLRAFLAVGALGSFTTYSTLVADAQRWAGSAGVTGRSLLFVGLSLALGVAAFSLAGVAHRAHRARAADRTGPANGEAR
ncbi:MAG: CrcB family protein [Myxococcota bacterium]